MPLRDQTREFLSFDLGSPRGQIPLLVVVSFTFRDCSARQGARPKDGEVVAVDEGSKATSSLRGCFIRLRTYSRVIVQRKVLLVLENDLTNRSDALELLRISLFANGWTDEGVLRKWLLGKWP